MKKIINKDNDLIKLVDKEKNSNHKNSNSGKVNIVKYKLKTEEIKTINNKTFKNEFNNNIITVLRVRPESAKEKQYSNIKIIKIESTQSMKLISPIEYNYFVEGTKYINNDRGLEVTKTQEYSYNFDHIFDYTSQQNQVYEYSASFLAKNIFEGSNSTIFAYGSIGSGKTYTMFGTSDKPGIIFRSINQISTIMKDKGLNSNYDLQLSFFQIYNETVIDLLSEDKKIKLGINNQIMIQEEITSKNNLKNNNGNYNKAFLMEITKKVITNPEEAYQILSSNKKNKIQLANGKFNNSAKAHYIVEINIANKENINPESAENNKLGKFIFADLAGFEKVSKVKPNSENFYINKSLFNLSTCISGLINNNNKKYIPWRDSKLTMILKDYLLGNSKVVLIATISPSFYVIENTFNTLNFAKKLKKVKTNSQKIIENDAVHIVKFDSIIENLREQISNVKKEINKNDMKNNSMLYSLNEKKNESNDEDSEINGNEIMQKCIEDIKEHFNKEIEVNKEINDVEFNISKINKENYFNQVNNNINKNNVKNEIKKLNDYQLKINSLYSKRYLLIQQRKNIQTIISKEARKDNNFGKYLMYVYKYYINLINQFQSKNRQNKIDTDMMRKDDQISNLSKQIKIRDDFLQDMNEKMGNSNVNFNSRRLIKLDELKLDPCLDISYIKREKNINQFIHNVASSERRFPRNFSMPKLIRGESFSKDIIKINIMNNNQLLPHIQKNNSNPKNMKNIKNDTSIFKTRIPSGFILKNIGRGNNIRNKFNGNYQKYYNIYHVSNNYHVGNFSASNPNYLKNKHNGNKYANNFKIISNRFESDYENKVKTILNKNFIFRYNNSPYSLENI